MSKTPKYMEIVHWTKAQIEERVFEPGDKFLSEKELSERFSLSRQTVRHALGVLENGGYIRRARGSGTYISQDSPVESPRKTMNVGIISTYLDDYIFPGIIRGIESVLTEHGYAMQFAFTYNKVANESRALQSMLEKKVDGLIVEPTKSGLPSLNLEIYRHIQARRIPLLFFNASYPALTVPYIGLDDEQAGLRATRYLLGKGHTRIAGIFLLSDLQGHQRYLGYLKALVEAGIELRDENILWYTTEDRPFLLNGSDVLLSRLGDCTAVLCYNDQLAIQLMDYLRRQGRRVPEDISVISIDNCDMAAMCDPPLTTMAHPMQQLGEAAARSLLAMIGGAVGETVLFPPQIVERESVGVPNR